MARDRRSARKSVEATSAFVRPAATRSDTRRSAGSGRRSASDRRSPPAPAGPARSSSRREAPRSRSRELIVSRACRFSARAVASRRARGAPSPGRTGRPPPRAARPLPRAGRPPPRRHLRPPRRGRGSGWRARAPRRDRAAAQQPPRVQTSTASSTRPSSSIASTCSARPAASSAQRRRPRPSSPPPPGSSRRPRPDSAPELDRPACRQRPCRRTACTSDNRQLSRRARERAGDRRGGRR